MKLYRTLEDFVPSVTSIVTMGSFDGVHLGHQKILSRLTTLASRQNSESVVISFWPHPRQVLHANQESAQVLTVPEEKIEFMEHAGIDHLLMLPFTRTFSELSPQEYVKSVLSDRIRARTIIIGYDHRFGKDRSGDIHFLHSHAAAYGFSVEEILRQDLENVAVSSTQIRQALLEGALDKANKLLGRPYRFRGKVVQGKQLGRTLGYPTANLQSDYSEKLVPARGVYAVNVMLGAEKFKGMLNIGVRPTVNGQQESIEVHIFDLDRDLYGQYLDINFLAYLRPEKKFSGLEELKQQLALDKVQAQAISI